MALPKSSTEQIVCLSSTVQTYSAAFVGNNLLNNATDFFVLRNPLLSTATMKVLRIELIGVATTAALIDIALIKRSTFTIGGAPIVKPSIPADSQNSNSSGVLLSLFAIPATLGTLVGTVRSGKLFISTAGATSSVPSLVWDFGTRPGQALSIYPGECLCLNNGGNAVGAGTTLNGSFEWTEE
jgi:hypothetical protein